MKNNDHLPSLDDLQAKIDKIKKPESGDSEASYGTDMGRAMRLIVDLMAGVIMGVGAGYFMDKWLTTQPLFMIIGLLLGMAAGVKNMLRSAELIDKKLTEQTKDDKKP